ncbi:hypothetical protein PFICI_13023 [Pestalotiopsis fici W106-1]|uniref:AAA+ ATPase domain-containing protein n=1 Tax=Pestalotiopsis fici (strain W106-1 / CGMCC3.15140) TaxID=1229662 RepID=W3WLA2_PESFW|nr:uncharacterized protein PFICI_13023 [Pestalotiopsis fici W106-1]ETS74539.1 hypothetical protein PFICI_13023 [Pestalotiopsis fici W106-1]
MTLESSKVALLGPKPEEAREMIQTAQHHEVTPANEAQTGSDADSDDPTENAKLEDQTMKAELKRLDRKYDDYGDKKYLERKHGDHVENERDWWDLFALCEIRSFWEDGELEGTNLRVNSHLLKQLLQDVVGDFPNEPIDASTDVELSVPAHCLFFYHDELKEEGMKRFANNAEGQAHINILLKYIRDTFEDESRSYKRAIKSESGAINYEHLWTTFRPGSLVYARVLGHPHAYKLLSTCYYKGQIPALGLTVQFIDYDGDKFGTRTTEFRIPQFSGTLRFDQLNIRPLDTLSNEDETRKQLIQRGIRFEKLVGQTYMHYTGVAVKKQQSGYERVNLTERVMIDTKTYHRLDPNDAFWVSEMTGNEAAKRQREIRKHDGGIVMDGISDTVLYDELLDEHRLITNATVRGYAFTNKRFLEFFVDQLSPIEWNTDCFNELVLDPEPKRTVKALVSMHARRSRNDPQTFDDIIKGKGQGLVLVLHGPPGVGKTLTAECVAEWVQCPLFTVSSGDLGTDSNALQKRLNEIMDMASTWRAVLLIDEADVFLERRTSQDLQRNSLVSIFLRELEYYTGILFLTTNRVATFDDAFKSRIHVPLRYSKLSLESRRAIWQNFCNRVPGGTEIDGKGLEQLAQHELNGRQIKNIVKTAESLAAFEGAKLNLDRLEEVSLIQAKFERDLLGSVDTGLDGVWTYD